MGFFDRFKKKQAEEPAYAPILDTTPEPELPDVHDLLEIAITKTKGGEWAGRTAVYYPEHDLRLTVNIAQQRTFPNGCTAQLIFQISHPFFDEDLVESAAGVGKTSADALRNAAESFCAGVLTFVLAALKCDGEHTITATLQGKEHVFRLPCIMAVQHMGEKTAAENNLWKHVEEKIPLYLGTKKAYWIKLYSANLDEPVCEARINGMVFPDLTDVLYKAVAGGKSTAKGCSDKMFVLLIQDDVTCEPCPFTKWEVKELAFKALDKMLEIRDEESHERIFAEIQQLTPHPYLGGEACAFLPEIYSHIFLQYRISDAVMPVSGVSEGEVRISQVRSYGYLESAVLQYLRERRPEPEDRRRILILSASFKAANQLVAQGSKLENLQFTAPAYTVPEDYVIW